MKMKFNDYIPDVHQSVFVAPNATIIGNVNIGLQSSVWFGAVIRGDFDKIEIGQRTNIQDLCLIHTSKKYSVIIGNDVTVGHRALVHGCRIKDRVLVGMGSIIMNGAEIGEDCIVAAGAVVTEGTKVPDGSLIMGVPGKVKRKLTTEELEYIKLAASHYIDYAECYVKGI
ncbi:MAG: gamma carbonic anhydrase family protein [Pseudomonadota bacterium]